MDTTILAAIVGEALVMMTAEIHTRKNRSKHFEKNITHLAWVDTKNHTC
jgi:hypothetical protein